MNDVVEKKKETKLTRKQAISELWHRSSLQYLLKGVQVNIYNDIKNANEHISVICCSRRLGKSHTLCVVAVELCLSKPGAIVKYVCPTKVQANEILDSVMKPILEEAPSALRPEWFEAKKRYVFPNNSQIQIWATDGGHIDSARGGVTDLGLVDEAGFCSDLNYVIDNVLSPGTDTVGGKIILASTPNFNQPYHEFNLDYVMPRQEMGTLKKFTIFDAPMISEKRRQQIIDRYGIDNPKFRCEYMCELQINPEKMVFSEFTPEKEKEIVVDNYPRPPFYDCYVSMDIGFKDLTAVLFAWYDFQKSAIIIEDEIIISGSELNSQYLSELIKQKEATHFKDKHGLTIQPTMRIADNNNPILLNDLYRLHNISFFPTAKDARTAQVNEVKLRIRQNRIFINKRCQTLIYHLRAAKWDKNFKEFERVRDDKVNHIRGAHCDAADSLIYLVRNISTVKNPYPDGYFSLRGDNIYSQPGQDKSNSSNSWVRTILNMGKKDKK